MVLSVPHQIIHSIKFHNFYYFQNYKLFTILNYIIIFLVFSFRRTFYFMFITLDKRIFKKNVSQSVFFSCGKTTLIRLIFLKLLNCYILNHHPECTYIKQLYIYVYIHMEHSIPTR